MAFKCYPSYSPACANSVTCAGRWATSLLISFTKSIRGTMSAVYGDTDSVFVSITKEEAAEIYFHGCESTLFRGFTRILYRILSFTPLASLEVSLVKSKAKFKSFETLQRDDDRGVHVFKSMVCVAPKMYAQMNTDRSVEVKGMGP